MQLRIGDLSGQLALQLHSGPETRVEFRDIELETLEPDDKRLGPFQLLEESKDSAASKTENIGTLAVDENGNYLGTYGWTTFNLYGTYKFTPNISLDLAVENIGDIHYRNFASGLSAPGRNLIVALRGRL